MRARIYYFSVPLLHRPAQFVQARLFLCAFFTFLSGYGLLTWTISLHSASNGSLCIRDTTNVAVMLINVRRQDSWSAVVETRHMEMAGNCVSLATHVFNNAKNSLYLRKKQTRAYLICPIYMPQDSSSFLFGNFSTKRGGRGGQWQKARRLTRPPPRYRTVQNNVTIEKHIHATA